MTALDTIRSQLKEAKPFLDVYAPKTMGWYERCLKTTNDVIPWLCDISVELCGFCEDVYNSPKRLRETWEKIKNSHDLGELGLRMQADLDSEDVLLSEIAGDVVSRVMSDFMIDRYPGGILTTNGKSDFPDLYLQSYDYSGLQKFKRGDEYGAALKGKDFRPVRIPDGVEIKTCRNNFHVDCHHCHVGLHVLLYYEEEKGVARMTNLWAAFLQERDYRICNINTGATTRKASFGPERFVSLLPQIHTTS